MFTREISKSSARKISNENKEFSRYRCTDVHESCLNKESVSARIASRIARFFPKKGRSTDR